MINSSYLDKNIWKQYSLYIEEFVLMNKNIN